MTKSCASGTAKYCKILVPQQKCPRWYQACILQRFLFWSPALDGCYILPPVFKPSHVLALTSMLWGSLARAGGALGSFGGVCGGSVQLLGSRGCGGARAPVQWPGVLAAGICRGMASASGWEHSRQRQSLINTLNHLCFDLSPDS